MRFADVYCCADIVVDNCAICRNHIMDLCEYFGVLIFASVFFFNLRVALAQRNSLVYFGLLNFCALILLIS